MLKKIVMVIAQTSFRDEELLEPKEIFEKAGYDVIVASPSVGICKGMLGALVKSNIAIDDLEISKDLVGVAVIGGVNAPSLMDYPSLGIFLNAAKKEKLVVGAICLGPMVLAYFDVLKGLHATVYKTDESISMFKDHGVTYLTEDVLVDEKVITANGPHASEIFAQDFIDLI